MAVYVRYGESTLVYNERIWTSEDRIPVTLSILNEITPRVIRGYLPQTAQASEVLTAAFGPDGWEIIHADPEPPPEPGVVY